MQPWTALWLIKDVPDRGYEVIRDRRPVGIRRCDDFEEAVEAIVHHDLYRSCDRVVLGWGTHQTDVDVALFRREPVAT